MRSKRLLRFYSLGLMSLFCLMYGQRPVMAQTSGEWTWTAGGNAANQPGSYGTNGVPASSNLPAGRWGSATWTDKNGNYWLFGGQGYLAAGNTTGLFLNDLWEFSAASKQWVWLGGTAPGLAALPGVYGALGVPAAGNYPGGRSDAATWTDSSGNLWLFGGEGYDSTNYSAVLNDLWEFNPTSGHWTWMAGSSVVSQPGQPGVYGTMGVPAGGNTPGSRTGPASWTDANGRLWLFGGAGYDGAANFGWLDDLWLFDPTISQWTWVGGSSTVNKNGASYGTLGAAAASNLPGGRFSSSTWIDSTGTLWLFGGTGYDATGVLTALNDLWRFSPTTKQWTWISGSMQNAGCTSNGPSTICAGQPGVYGTMGTSSPGETPGGRAGAASWTDGTGTFWLFGGQGYDAADNESNLNDLWSFAPGSGLWTWRSGSTTASKCGLTPIGSLFCAGATGSYGSKNVPSPGDTPGGRFGSSAWVSSGGGLVLFGGIGVDGSGNSGVLNDVWAYAVPGTSASADFTMATPPSSLTVSSGQSGTVIITVTPVGNFSSAISFTCSGLPAGAACSFSPASLTPQGAAATTTLTVTTTSQSASVSSTAGATWFAALLLPPMLWAARRKRSCLITGMIVISISLALGSIAGCGSSPGDTTTSTMTINAVSGSLQHASSVVLTIK